MNELKRMVENAKQIDGFTGQRAEYFKKLEKREKQKKQSKEESQKSSQSYKWILFLPLGGLGAFVLWYYFIRYQN